MKLNFGIFFECVIALAIGVFFGWWYALGWLMAGAIILFSHRSV